MDLAAAAMPEAEILSNKHEDINHVDHLDAGALFVLKSRGSWLHCGYHLTTSIVTPALLSLPFAFTFLGWVGGIICLVIGGLVTFYSYNLLSLVLEHHAFCGRRQLRFRDMATDILGPKWGKYFVGPLQFAICYGGVVASILLGGQNLKFIYLLANPNGTMKLYQFITIFGGYSKNEPTRSYSIVGSSENQLFGAFNGISIIATTLASGIIPEIQATIVPPVKGKMFKGLCLCYSVIVVTYFSVAISGYWAFGNKAKGTVLSNFMADNKPLLPTWFLAMTNAFCLLQVSAVAGIYLQPTNEVLEKQFADPKKDQFSTRNVVPRLISRSLAVIVATVFAAMLPFFGDIMAFFGAFGCIPLDFILPMILYNVTFKPPKRAFIFWGNTLIVSVSSILVAIGAVASVRQIVLDAKTFHLFANM